jgi:hypothetical protein
MFEIFLSRQVLILSKYPPSDGSGFGIDGVTDGCWLQRYLSWCSISFLDVVFYVLSVVEGAQGSDLPSTHSDYSNGAQQVSHNNSICSMPYKFDQVFALSCRAHPSWSLAYWYQNPPEHHNFCNWMLHNPWLPHTGWPKEWTSWPGLWRSSFGMSGLASISLVWELQGLSLCAHVVVEHNK